MTDLVSPTKVDQKIALDWLYYSLRQGDVISDEVLRMMQARGGFSYALAPDTVDVTKLMKPSEGGISGYQAALDALGRVLDGFAKQGATCVVIEDDTRRRKDPKPDVGGLPTAFFGEMVVHWSRILPGAQEAIYALHRGSGSYPLNAFVTAASADELGLIHGANLGKDVGDHVARSLIAVIVAAYDGETFMIWEPTQD